MATLIPPTRAFRWIDKYHFVRPGCIRMTACEEFVWEGIPSDKFFEKVSDISSEDICNGCLGAMEAVDEVVDELEHEAVTEEPPEGALEESLKRLGEADGIVIDTSHLGARVEPPESHPTWGTMERKERTWESSIKVQLGEAGDADDS